MHICKLINLRKHIGKQNKSDQQIITLNNHINKQIHKQTKQTPGNNIFTNLIANTIYTPCGAPKQNYLTKNHLHNRTETFASKLKQPSLI